MADSVVGHLREFALKTSDWTIFKARLENFFAANGIKIDTDADKMRAILLNALDEDAYQLIFDLVSPAKPEEKTYKQIVEVFNGYFKPQQSPFAARYKFYSAQKEHTESAAEWAARLRGLAVGCEFGPELKVSLRDKFVFGFEKGAVMDRLMEEGIATDFERMVGLAASKMAAREIHDIMVKTEPIHHIQGGGSGVGARLGGGGSSGHYRSGSAHAPVMTRGARPSHSHSQGRYQGQDQQGQFQHGGNCEVCGRRNHNKDKCIYKNYICNFCKKIGHLANVCRSKNKNFGNQRQHFLEDLNSNNYSSISNQNTQNVNNSDDDIFLFNISDRNIFEEGISDNSENLFKLKVLVQNINLVFHVDTGSSISCLSKEFYMKYFPNIALRATNKRFIFYNGVQVTPEGVVGLKIIFNNKENCLDFFVMENGGPPLLGRDFLAMYNLNLSVINNISQEGWLRRSNDPGLDNLFKKYNQVFSPGLGYFREGIVKINLKNVDTTPKFIKARPIPFAIKKQVEQELNRLLSLGIISPVDYSPWATPIVPVFKKNGQIRICGDFKVTVNPAIEIDQHYMPRIEELFAKLQGGREFSKLDLSQAFQQIGLDENSKVLLTISTHLGLFKYNRLTFGVACAPAKFQKIMDALLGGVEGCAVFQDDILISGKDKKEHLENLEKVLFILKRAGLKLNYDKCIFFAKRVEYLGFIIDTEGLHPSGDKTLAIDQAPRPTNVKELQSFLGSINFYGRFVQNMSAILSPLYKLLQKNISWVWNNECEIAFNKIKEILKSSQVLVHFDPDLELKLTVDASLEGVGAVLSHKFPNSEEKPIAFASRTLSKSERSYPQIEKEGLAIIFGVLKFNQYLYNKKFTLVTDMRPLVTIFSPNKAIPQFSANRLRRWAIILSGYQYDIEYIASKKNTADWLSRLPNKNSNDFFETDNVDIDYFNFLDSNNDFVLNFESVKQATNSDALLTKVKRLIESGWPQKVKECDLKPYFAKRFDFFIKDGCIFWNHRIVIPLSLQNEILNQLHKTHMGVVKMKGLARSYVWFPNLDLGIEKIVKSCDSCMLHSNNPPKSEIVPWPWPKGPWERIHLDYFELKRKNYLVVIDAFSKWLEVFEMSNISSSTTIKVLRNLFARFGLPITVVSDNGRSLVSDEFEDFLRKNSICHLTSPPYSPSSNGAAENSVKTVKNALKKALEVNNTQDTHLALSRFLFDYRNTPHSTTGVSPAKLIFGRQLRTRFSTLLPIEPKIASEVLDTDDIRKRVENIQKQQVKDKGGKNWDFEMGELVLVKDYRNVNHPSYIRGKIVKVIGKRTYLVEISDLQKTWKRHCNQIKKHEDVSTKVPHIPINLTNAINVDELEQVNEPQSPQNCLPASPSQVSKSITVSPKNKGVPPNSTPTLRRSKRTRK